MLRGLYEIKLGLDRILEKLDTWLVRDSSPLAVISHDDGDRTLELLVLSDPSIVNSNIKLGVFSNSVIQPIVRAEQIVKPFSIPFLRIQTLPLALLLKASSQSDLRLELGTHVDVLSTSAFYCTSWVKSLAPSFDIMPEHLLVPPALRN
ncbi:hypothetical protein Scep_006960 [Stephania cephalantha]|uniref:Uncharacterized protein n=1 Tax=Stephania cephalantha TaxID=152367 RepID=A0AAP0KAN8_9MAGN